MGFVAVVVNVLASLLVVVFLFVFSPRLILKIVSSLAPARVVSRETYKCEKRERDCCRFVGSFGVSRV